MTPILQPTSTCLCFVAYYRTAAEWQCVPAPSLEAQRLSVEQYEWFSGAEGVASFTEIETSENCARPQLLLAMAEAQRRKSSLLIAKIGDLIKNTDFLSVLSGQIGLEIMACDFARCRPFDPNTLLSSANHQYKTASERTRKALADAKTRGVSLGAAAADHAHVARAVWMAQAAERRAKYTRVIQQIRRSGISTLKGIAEELNSRNVPAPRGGRWSATQVSRAEER